MPQAKRSTSTRSNSKFKQPAALKRLTTSLDTAQKALAELTKGSGRDVGTGAKDVYADLRKFVTSARSSSNKLGKALQRDFDQAQKELAKAAKATSSRSTAKRSTSSRSASSRASSGRSTTRRASSGTGTTRRASSATGATRRASSATGATKRTSSSRRGTTKS